MTPGPIEQKQVAALRHGTVIDHLNAGLYIDYLESLEELVPVGEHPSGVEEGQAAGI